MMVADRVVEEVFGSSRDFYFHLCSAEVGFVEVLFEDALCSIEACQVAIYLCECDYSCRHLAFDGNSYA